MFARLAITRVGAGAVQGGPTLLRVTESVQKEYHLASKFQANTASIQTSILF
jgi:hypothetical protein